MNETLIPCGISRTIMHFGSSHSTDFIWIEWHLFKIKCNPRSLHSTHTHAPVKRAIFFPNQTVYNRVMAVNGRHTHTHTPTLQFTHTSQMIAWSSASCPFSSSICFHSPLSRYVFFPLLPIRWGYSCTYFVLKDNCEFQGSKKNKQHGMQIRQWIGQVWISECVCVCEHVKSFFTVFIFSLPFTYARDKLSLFAHLAMLWHIVNSH